MGRKEQWTFKPLEIILVGRGKIATVVMVEVGGGSEEDNSACTPLSVHICGQKQQSVIRAQIATTAGGTGLLFAQHRTQSIAQINRSPGF